MLAAFDDDAVARNSTPGRWGRLASAWSPARASAADTGARVGFHPRNWGSRGNLLVRSGYMLGSEAS